MTINIPDGLFPVVDEYGNEVVNCLYYPNFT